MRRSHLSWPLNSRSFKGKVAIGQMNVQRVLEAERNSTLLADRRLVSHLEETSKVIRCLS